MSGDGIKLDDVTTTEAEDGEEWRAGGRAGGRSGPSDALGTSYGSNVSGSQVHSLAVGEQSRAITVVHHHGLSFTEAERLFGLLFEQNFPRLAEVARTEARRRVDEFTATFMRGAAAQKVTEEQLANFSEPDVQFVLNAAVQGSARRNSPRLREVLAGLILRRLHSHDDALESLALGEAVLAAGRLTNNHLHILALCFLTMYADWFDGPVIWSAANAFLQEMVVPFMSAKMSGGDLLHIEYAGCATLGRGPVLPFHNVIAHKYSSLFHVDKLEELNGPRLVPSVIERESPVLNRLCELSEQVGFYLLRPTTVGVVLAVTTIEQVTGKRLSIDEWLR
ncbi:LPO_1073/Vpar_1526 family protein [Sorangium sp. So ce260]|uniref:LPO_1073/Vpar_1526 family protein n=1 Tax=Sorangium sp. So ce260 TaxID=3133291 RepID=UPI003F62787A